MKIKDASYWCAYSPFFSILTISNRGLDESLNCLTEVKENSFDFISPNLPPKKAKKITDQAFH